MVRHASLLKLAAAGCLALLLAGTTAAAADPNGTWTWTFSRGDQEVELSLNLKAEGEKLTGTLTLPFGGGFELDIEDGTFKNDEVSFKTVFERNGNSFETKYHGKVEGDTIQGNHRAPARRRSAQPRMGSQTRQRVDPA